MPLEPITHPDDAKHLKGKESENLGVFSHLVREEGGGLGLSVWGVGDGEGFGEGAGYRNKAGNGNGFEMGNGNGTGVGHGTGDGTNDIRKDAGSIETGTGNSVGGTSVATNSGLVAVTTSTSPLGSGLTPNGTV